MPERGSMLPMVAALAFAGLVVVALAADTALIAATYREAAFAADVGAEAGAAMIDHDSVYAGGLVLNPPVAIETAIEAALEARPRPQRSAVASASVDRICVEVTQPFRTRFLGGLGAAPGTVTVTACAEPRAG